MFKNLRKWLLLMALLCASGVTVAQITFPYSTGFEGLSTGQLPTGWQQLQSGSSGSGTFPAVYQYASNARNGSVYFEFESSTGQTELAALPEMNDINLLQLSFYASVMTFNFLFEVGVMEGTTFVPLDTINLTTGSGGNWHGSYHLYTVYFNNYTGTGNRMAMRTTSSGSYTLMIDDLEVDYIPTCPAPINVTMDSAGVDWMALHWSETGTATSWVVEYSTSPIAAADLGQNLGTTVNVYGTPATTLTSLDTSTTYYIYVYADCGTEYSRAASIMASTLVGEAATIPYICNFEVDGSNGWELVNGTQTNQWHVGTATSNGGSRSIYISNDNGSSNSYTNSSTSYTYALRTINFSESGEYTFSYDWKCQGESHYYDFGRVFLAPSSYQWTAGVNPASGTYAFASWNIPSGWIELTENFSSPRTMSQSSSWRTASGTFILPSAGAYNLVLAWANDASGGSQPPLAVDNVAISRNTCPAPFGLASSNVMADEVTLSWHPGGSESMWEVSYGSTTDVASDTFYTFYGLTPDTTYLFTVRALCDAGDSSLPVSINVTTPPTCTAPTGRSIVGSGSDWVAVGWNGVGNAMSYQIAYGASGFTPNDNTIGIDVYDTTYTVSNLSSDTLYAIYVRTDCGGGDYSAWASFGTVMPGAYIMTQSIDTLRACGVTVFDNGGPNGNYAASSNNTLVILSPSPDSTISLWGTYVGEGCCDYLTIFEGVGTSGNQLFYGCSPSSGTTVNIGPFISETGALTIRFTSDGSVQYGGYELHTNCVYLSECVAPVSLNADSVSGDTAWMSWVDTTGGYSFELAYGPAGFNPDTATENVIPVYGDTAYMLTGLTMGMVYDVYVRADCSGEYSMWRGPVAIRPGYNYIMPVTGTDVIRGCGYTIYDNGGPDGNYDNYCDATVTVYSTSPDSLFVLSGTYTSEGCCDYLYIYDGNSTSGNLLYSGYSPSSGTQVNIGPFISNTGAFTIRFTSDVSGTYAGFALSTACVAPPDCDSVRALAVHPGVTSAFVQWNTGTIGSYSGATVEYCLAGDSTWTLGFTTTETYGALTGLTANTAYQLRVIPNCSEGNGPAVGASFTTINYGCAEIDTANSVSDTIGNGTSTSTYIPSYSFYNYGLSQQIYTAAELGHGGAITAISVMPSAISQQRTYEIYMAHTSQSSLSGYIHPSDMVRVYDGAPLTLTANQWITFQLDNPFTYSGSQNLLVCFRDMTGSYVSGNAWYVHTNPNGNSVYSYQDGSAYDPFTQTGGTTLSSRNNMIFDFMACAQTSTCPAPVATLMDVQSYSVTVAWAPGDVETSWNLYYRMVGDSVFTSVGTTTSMTHTFTGLYGSTEYEFKIEASCAGSNDGAAILRTFTECGSVPLPYTEDFESQTAGSVYSRECWYTGSTNLGTSYANPTAIHLTGDPNTLCLIYNGGYLIMPEMSAPLNQLQIRFNFVQGADSVRFIMGVLPTPTTPIDSIHVIDTLMRSNYDTSAYAYVIYPLDGISDTSGHITFWDAFADNYSFIDNIVVEYIPNCANVSEVTASSVTGTSAVISWTSSSNATSYLIEYGTRGFTPGTGTIATSASTAATLNGLNPGISYQAYVYAICNNDTSIASQVCNFTTACAPYTALPYTHNFENVLGPGDASTNVVPNCWASALLPAGAGHEQPHVFYSTDPTHAPSQQYCFYFEGIGIAALPEMGVPLDSLMITFHEWNSDPSAYGLVIGAVDNIDSGFASTFVPIDTIPFIGTGNEFEVVSILNSYTGTANRIAIASYNTGSNAYADQYLDNLVISRVPDCIAPMRVRTNALTHISTDLIWDFSNAPSYTIEYGVHGFTPGTGTTLTSTTPSVSLTGLTPYTQYDVYMVSHCSPATASDTTLYTFTTLRGAPVTSYPYVCTFADTLEANAWEPVNGSQTNGWYVGTATSYGSSDNRSLYVSDNNGTSNSYTNTTISFSYAYRTFVMNAGGYNIGFNWKANGESNYDYIRAWLAPADFVFTPGQTPDGGTSSYNYTSSNPAGWIPLDGGSKLNLESSWQSRNTEVAIPTAGNYNLVFMWANDGSGGSAPAGAIDNVEVYLNTCPMPQGIQASSVGVSYIDLDWTDVNTPVAWQVEYGPSGFTRGTGTLINATSHPVHISGLDTLTAYDFYVRPICSATDTGRWSERASASTSFCDNANVATNSTVCTQSTSYFPAYATYNYSYSEVILDSADIDGSGDIVAWAFKPQNLTANTYYTNCTVYMAHTNQTNLSSGFIQDTATFVKVFTGDLNFTNTEWQTIMLDTTFTWDGHSNIVVAVDRRHGSWTSSGYFDAFSASSSKARYIYQDSGPYNIGSISGGTATSTVPIYRLISCGAAGCRQPVISSVTKDYHSATVTWSGDGTNYEVNIKESAAIDWPATDIAVTGNSYTFNGLMPATNYTFRVRQDCTADSLDYSEWTISGVLTDSLPCLTPDSLHATAVTNATATFDWNVNGNENVWDIHVWYGSFDSIYRVITRPATVGGFAAGITYNAAIRAVCGINRLEGDWSDTVQFTTAVCPDITGLSTSNVTTNSVTLNWSSNPMALRWNIEYGPTGFTQGQGTQAVSNTNSYVVTGLSDGITYDFYVKAVCGDDWTSENWVGTSATTQEGTIPCDAPTGVSTAVADNSVTVNWTAGTGNISFELEYGPRGFSHGAGSTTTATGSPAVIANLDYETQYDVYVRAVCEQNIFSPWSTVSTFTTGERPSEDCDPVQNLTVTNVTETSADINWQPGASGEGWQVELTDETGSTVRDNVTSETHISLTGLVNCKNYTVKVRTVCEDNNFSAYVTASFRTLGCEGIKEVEGINCRIFPNPATSSTTISVTGVNGMVRIAVVDMNGRTVATETLECSADCEKTMEVDKLAQGAYFVRITAENTNMVRKLIVR